MAKQLIDADATAERLGTTTPHVYSLARRRLLPCVRLGRRLRFDPDEIDAHVKRGGQSLPGGWRAEPDDDRAAG